MAELKRALLGYSSASVHAVLADRERMFELASKDARSAQERAERLAAELRGVKGRLEEAESQLQSARELGEALAADLERSVAEREAMERQLRAEADRAASLQTGLEERTRERDDITQQLTAAWQTSADLQQTLRERHEALATAEEEASKAQVWLRRALEESAENKRSLTQAQERIAQLEGLLASRAEPETGVASASAEEQRAPESPSTASELAAVLQVTEEAVVRIMESTRARADEELRTIDSDRERIAREVATMRTWRDQAAPMIATMKSTMDDVLGQLGEIGVRVGEVLRPVSGAVGRLTSELASLDGLSRTAPRLVQGGSEGGARVIELRDEQTAAREGRRDQ